ncbi:hypothetical protein HMPREF9455_02441 [Dysgonomonas gadei ATCC BAA-286]|jgi:hypothetical protein|uniref:Uncharacterized protein n=1 Tax=Dysgonomonas gadei ATCC BAA-286 TaxID=742766 RepID=F5IZC4_9BACT|nr:hypothetical protein HMPREF9455_02441 [Dysgonomonas gadei ATCC BAA-286]
MISENLSDYIHIVRRDRKRALPVLRKRCNNPVIDIRPVLIGGCGTIVVFIFSLITFMLL